MMQFAGLPVKLTDAVFPDHVKVERGGIFCGPKAYAEFMAYFRNTAGHEGVVDAYRKSLHTGKSVKVMESLK